MATPTLIYCGGGNPRFADIARVAGYQYGCQLPNSKPYAPVYFADQNWKEPDRVAYMASLAKHRPCMATVLDWEREEQFCEVLSWAEEAAQFVEYVVIIPKVINETHRIPNDIGGKPIMLGFSVPTKFGATSVPVWEFAGRRVHLLGGSPHRQMQEWQYLSACAEVVSADGNMAQKMATRNCCYWTAQTSRYGHWQPLFRAVEHDAPTEAFHRSCENIFAAWKQLENSNA